jgi:hypothetical protein
MEMCEKRLLSGGYAEMYISCNLCKDCTWCFFPAGTVILFVNSPTKTYDVLHCRSLHL